MASIFICNGGLSWKADMTITDFFLEYEHLYMKNPTTVSAKYRNPLESDKIRFRETIKKKH